MKFLSSLFFLILPVISSAQWQDNFDDGDFNSSPSWTGDTADFNVNQSGQLQLDAAVAGISFISTQSSPDMFNELEWRFFIHQNFSPSSGNYGRIYLVSDQQDLAGPVNGYYLQFGESLSSDAVELFRQDGTTSVSVCRANEGAIASSFSFGLKVTRDAIGLWTVWIDSTGGTNYRAEASGAEAMYTSSAYFGVFCEYTTGNRSNFFFDDFYTGPMIHDTIPPNLAGIFIQSSTSLDLQFTEAVDPVSARLLSNYSVDSGIGNPVSAQIQTFDPARVQLVFSHPFVSAFQHSISLSGIEDLSGNTLQPATVATFTYYPPIAVQVHDVIFTEVMFEPSSSGGLPDFEYVEIYNRTPQAIPLKDWSITDGSATSIFPEIILLPNTYLILCGSVGASAFSAYGSAMGFSPFPVLNNDVGDILQLLDDQGRLIEEIGFSNQTYRDSEKDDGGWSLERIDTAFTCIDPSNWRASVAPLGGTPGQKSSVSGIYRDIEKPMLLCASLTDSVHLNIVFTERLNNISALDPSMYMISDGIHASLHPDSVFTTTNPMQYSLRLPFVADESIYNLSVNSGLNDCPGNELDISQSVRFAIPEAVDSGDVVLNEILFNPQNDGFDFVELYNRSQKVLDLMQWRIAEAPYDEPENPYDSKGLGEQHHLFFPGDFIVLTQNSTEIIRHYETPGIRPFLEVNEIPDFNSTDGSVILYDSLGKILDQFSYSEEMHFPLLAEKIGVSLERLSSEIITQDKANWHSASSSSGFASPGFQNSIGWINSEIEDGLTIEPAVFSPDNDGFNDLLFIRLKKSGKQGIAQVYVFDLQGQLIRKLARQNLLGDDFLIVWDGLNDAGELAAIGTYVIYLEVFDADGQVKKNKLAFALTMK